MFPSSESLISHLQVTDHQHEIIWNSGILKIVFVPKVKEKHRLRVFENRVLRRMFRHKREEVTGSWRRLHNEELHNLYAAPNIIKKGKGVSVLN
jgi:hypothetical protein